MIMRLIMICLLLIAALPVLHAQEDNPKYDKALADSLGGVANVPRSPPVPGRGS